MSRWLLYGLHRQTHTHDFEDRRQTTERRITFWRQSAVKLCRIQVRLLGYGLHTAECLGHLAQHDKQFTLVGILILQDVIDHLPR